MTTVYYSFITLPIGNVSLLWIQEPAEKLLSINLPNGAYIPEKDVYMNKLADNVIKSDIKFTLVKKMKEYPDFITLFCRTATEYFKQKKPMIYPEEYLTYDALTSFAKNILMTLYRTEFGQLISYNELSEKAGYQKAARAVGNVMNKNPYPLLIPCHRVIKSDGSIGGFAPGTEMKELLLKHEGSLNRIK